MIPKDPARLGSCSLQHQPGYQCTFGLVLSLSSLTSFLGISFPPMTFIQIFVSGFASGETLANTVASMMRWHFSRDIKNMKEEVTQIC